MVLEAVTGRNEIVCCWRTTRNGQVRVRGLRPALASAFTRWGIGRVDGSTRAHRPTNRSLGLPTSTPQPRSPARAQPAQPDPVLSLLAHRLIAQCATRRSCPPSEPRTAMTPSQPRRAAKRRHRGPTHLHYVPDRLAKRGSRRRLNAADAGHPRGGRRRLKGAATPPARFEGSGDEPHISGHIRDTFRPDADFRCS